jgi:diaminopimelate epimerase
MTDGMRFEKFQALGNDFLIVRESDLPAPIAEQTEFFRLLCDRHFGAGADGIEVLLNQTAVEDADFAVRLFNSDGGETPISGNGTRCVGAYLYYHGLWSQPRVRIATGAGIKKLTLVERELTRFVFATEMGQPRLRSGEIPIRLEPPRERVVGQHLDLDGQTIEFTASSMGNPHCSIFVDDFASTDWHTIGAALEVHPIFPDRTNVEFIRILDRDRIEVRFWERGVGPTLASGTGACGAAVAAMLDDRTDRHVRVQTEAGELIVEWNDDGMIVQTGEARPVYEGHWPGI